MGGVAGTAPFGYRVPSSVVPRTTLQQSHRGQPATPKQSVLGQSVGRVLATGRHKPACRRPQRGHHVPITLDDRNRGPSGAARPGRHDRRSKSLRTRRTPVRNSARSCAESASRLPCKARITTRSEGSRSLTMRCAACRSFRATRWRSTAPPTDLATMNPTRGAPSEGYVAPRYPCTTRSGCAARTPCLTVWVKSADRVIRYRAGSTWCATRGSGSQ